MKNFNFKKFFLATIVLLMVLLVFDIVYDRFIKDVSIAETFALKNLVFKILAALAGAYFYATYQSNDEETV
jgi:uncharacterized membrane protein